jgi:predicted nucleotidyltransferase
MSSPPAIRAIGTLEPEALSAIRDAVLRHVDPLLVVLFGSQATGTAHAGSDVDLLVIDTQGFGPARSRRRLIGAIRRAIPPYRSPVDVLLFDADEMRRWRNTTNHVIARALEEGVVLYERPGAR